MEGGAAAGLDERLDNNHGERAGGCCTDGEVKPVNVVECNTVEIKEGENEHVKQFRRLMLQVYENSASSKSELESSKACLKYLLRILEDALRKPVRLNVNNFSFKKFVTGFKYGQEILCASGFVSKDSHLELNPDSNGRMVISSLKGFMTETLNLIEHRLEELCAGSRKMEGPRLPCQNKCGFFGDMNSDGYCSLCFKEIMKQRMSGPAINPSSAEEPIKKKWSNQYRKIRPRVIAVCLFANMLEKKRAQQVDEEKHDPASPKKCFTCGKRVGLAMTAVLCKCGHYYCVRHRSTIDHDCSYNFKHAFKRSLEKSNPSVVGKKLDRI